MTNEEIILKTKEEIRLCGLSPDTEIEYLTSIRVLVRYYDNRPLEELHEPELRAFLLHLIESGRKAGTVNRYNSSFRFVYGAVLERNLNYQMIPRRRIHRELPQIMRRNEIVRFLESIDNLRDRAVFETIYGSGIRLSEAAHLRVQDIDSDGMRLFVYQGKCNKDRYTLLSQRNLEVLRNYWKEYRPNHPEGYLFYTKTGKITVLRIERYRMLCTNTANVPVFQTPFRCTPYAIASPHTCLKAVWMSAVSSSF